jgi:hypothetical protein
MLEPAAAGATADPHQYAAVTPLLLPLVCARQWQFGISTVARRISQRRLFSAAERRGFFGWAGHNSSLGLYTAGRERPVAVVHPVALDACEDVDISV